MLAGIAEFERELIRARTGEGRKRAQARGVKLGRPSKLSAYQRQEALQRLAAGETQTDIAILWREPCDHWPATGTCPTPFRGKRGRPRGMKRKPGV
jgi:transposase